VNKNEELSNEKSIDTVSIQNTEQLWDLIAEYLRRFYQAWEQKSASFCSDGLTTVNSNAAPDIKSDPKTGHDQPELPDINGFLPKSPLPLRQLSLIELIKVDMELRFEHFQPFKSVHDYSTEFPELIHDGKVNEELLFEEVDLCKRHHRSINSAELLDRFPAQRETILKLLSTDNQISPNVDQSKGKTRTQTRVLRKPISLRNIKPGTRIDDFELLIELGKGSFATVFLARQFSMQRLVALKISSDRGDEPKTLAQLDCKNIVRVFDVRDILDPPCRLLYMKFVAGGSLHDIITQSKELSLVDRTGEFLLSVIDERASKTGQDAPLDSRTRHRLLSMKWFEVVFWIGSQIGEGLAYAHKNQVLHRDLKPANVLLTTEGVPQIVDFNVSFCEDVEGSTAESFFGGSLAYMSPEQLEAFDPTHPRKPNSLSASSDIFSLGVIIWEMLFGQRPYQDQVRDTDFPQMLRQLVEHREAFLDNLNIPEDAKLWDIDLKGLFAKLLEPNPDNRCQKANAIAGELRLLSDQRSRNLLRPAETTFSRLMKRWLVSFVIAAVVLPSLGAAVFNYFYNFKSIIEPKGESVATIFEQVQLIINATAFPIGIGILMFLGWTLRTRIKRLNSKENRHGEANSAFELRRHITRLPLICVIIPISIWTLAGLAYPVAMNIAGSALTWSDSLHFVTSLILCGLIAAVYPFFLTAFTAIRVWYPIAFKTEQIQHEDIRMIDQFIGRSWFFMALAALLPTFSILLMVTTQVESDRNLLAILAGTSFFGLGLIFMIFQKLQRHLTTVRFCIEGLLQGNE